jgi:hypothetical protein
VGTVVDDAVHVKLEQTVSVSLPGPKRNHAQTVLRSFLTYRQSNSGIRLSAMSCEMAGYRSESHLKNLGTLRCGCQLAAARAHRPQAWD